MSCCTQWPTSKDPQLHAFYAKRLLEPGWGGELTAIEYDYIRRHLEKDPRLRSKWGFHRGRGWKLSEELIRHRALLGVEDTPEDDLSGVDPPSADRDVSR